MFDVLVYVHLIVSAQPYKDVFCLLFVGSRIGTSVYGIHRNAVVWENPDVSQELKAGLYTIHNNVMPFSLYLKWIM